LTTNLTTDANILRVLVKKEIANLHQDCDIMIDQIRAVDNKRLIKKIGILPQQLAEKVAENILIVFDLV